MSSQVLCLLLPGVVVGRAALASVWTRVQAGEKKVGEGREKEGGHGGGDLSRCVGGIFPELFLTELTDAPSVTQRVPRERMTSSAG